MAAHATEHETPEPTSGAALLPAFAVATILATIAIGVLIASPSSVAAVVALASVIGFAAGLVGLLSHLIGSDEH